PHQRRQRPGLQRGGGAAGGLVQRQHRSCVLNQDCILPCQFRNRVTNMTWESKKSLIVSYNHRGSRYSESFRSRASLFEDQISRGNGDLLLRGVKVDDEGGYECNVFLFVQQSDLEIAPVSDIRIHQDGNRITCSSEGIYPQPELTWSTEPPSNTTLQNRTTVHQTEEKLYDISSSLTGPDGSDRIYSCTIRTRRNQRRATLNIPGPEKNLVVPELIRRTVVCVVIAAAAAGFIMFYKKKMEESEALGFVLMPFSHFTRQDDS
uniref:Ig-like domain-containing protein n=1 Tax=Xiphophorus maculatus TaxID=8083 RepID=A0A3B5PSP0_XIPMA